MAGAVEASSRRMGNRSKSLLKKGQCLGEHAILEGEPAGETCSAGSPVLALIVNRQVWLPLPSVCRQASLAMLAYIHCQQASTAGLAYTCHQIYSVQFCTVVSGEICTTQPLQSPC